MSQIVQQRAVRARCAEIGSILWFSFKKRRIPFYWESARFLGWHLPVRTALGSVADGTEWGAVRGGLADTVQAGAGCASPVTANKPHPDVTELLVKHACALPSRLSGTFLFN